MALPVQEMFNRGALISLCFTMPYVYNDALDYYYRLYLAKVANENIPEVFPEPEVQEIEIGIPRVYINPPKLFEFGEPEERE